MKAKDYVVKLLESYPSMKQEIQMLKFEIKAYSRPHQAADIENKALSHVIGERVSGSRLSDKSADLAVEFVDQQRNRVYMSLCERLERIGYSVDRFEHNMSTLPGDEAEAIRLFYWERPVSWQDIEKKSNLSKSAMLRRKSKGIAKLEKMYMLLMELGVIIDDELF